MKTFNLPDLGEGLPEAEIVSWKVKVGDEVKVDQPMLEVENAKAVMEIPAPYAGKIAKLHGGVGDVIETGKPLVDIDTGEGIAETPKPTEKKDASREDAGTVVGQVTVGTEVTGEKVTSITAKSGQSVKATPAVRAIAKKLGVDLSAVVPTGNKGMVTAEDVKKAAAASSDAGPIEELKGARRAMSRFMTMSHAEVVPTTIVEDADIQSWDSLRVITLRMVRAIAKACQAEPSLNAWYDSKAVGRRLHETVELGLAVDTEGGLYVPVIKDAANKNAETLRAEIDTIKTQIENRTIPPEAMRGATITLSNVGTIAGRYASPVIIPPMVAIIAAGKVRDEVKAIDGEITIRKMLPLSLTFDHRAVTGGEAARFLGVMIEDLQQAE